MKKFTFYLGLVTTILTSSLCFGQNIEAYFSPFDDVDKVVLAELDKAQEEVILAHYNIRHQEILNKLVELKNRGISVKVVVDKKNAEKDYNIGDDYLEENGIEILRTKPVHNYAKYAIMHLKASVIDQKTVMTGSYNWNNTATMSNDENMLIIRDERVAEIYRNEIIEILENQEVVIDSGIVNDEIEIHFSPEQKLNYIIKDHIEKATKKIDIAMFTFTEWKIGYALLDAIERGVKVRVVVEKKQTKYSSLEDRLEEAGALVIRGANKLGAHSAMHNKFCIIDDHKVITGASNWTKNGTMNSYEDIIILKSQNIVSEFKIAFADLLHI